MTVIKPGMLAKMTRGSAEYFRFLERFLEQIYRQSGAVIGQVDDENIPAIATAQTAADTAQTALELNNVTVESLSQLVTADAATSTWPADSTTDHVLEFKRQLVTIATHTIRAVFTQSTGLWTVTSFAETLEATVETITGSGGSDAKAVVSHTGSGIIGKVTLQATDPGVAGTSPSK